MTRTIYIFLFLSLLLSHPASFAQIGISGTPHSSAVLDLQSPTNNKAFYPPRLTSAQRQAIPNPQPGAFVYDSDKSTMYLYDGQNWLPLLTTDPNLLAPASRTAADGATNDQFGTSVAISGDYAIIGANGKTIGGKLSQGAAYIFVRSGNSWNQLQQLTANDGAASDLFGRSVAISGDYAIVGAHFKTINSSTSQGAAYVFLRSGNNWNLQQRLTANDGAPSDHFGWSVAISGDNAIIGAENKFVFGVSQGVAYVFTRSGITWTQQQRLTASDGTGGDYFGSCVAISGDYAIVGAPSKAISPNTNQGAAYMFVRGGGTWTQQQRFVANDGAANDHFGNAVAISGDYAIVGAANKTVNSNSAQGAAYVFARTGSTWNQQLLTANDGVANDDFGTSVSISGDYAVIGAASKTIGSNQYQGAAYVFKRSGSSWIRQQSVTDNSTSDTFNGSSVGLSNGTFIIGGPGFQNNRGKVAFGTVN
ncbi:FG-GAP repeat protein [Spirosoma sp. BT702]|uniref:FG-GAP repeat protein n=1 Tax=Spirosoma profusum TaxID=2771354 RepID=A0A926XXM9_9BACT|nr:FG-GAP repeat protein [Spirosoma profusum]MBD2701941.1 FG-GAP repeat protein [Spirosoma profusum]